MSRNTVRCHATWRKITLLVVKVTLARRWEPKRLRLRLFTIPPAPAGRSASTWRPRPPGLTWSTTPSGDYVPWPSPADVHPARPDNHRVTPDHLEPATTRDDTRALLQHRGAD